MYSFNPYKKPYDIGAIINPFKDEEMWHREDN